MVGPSLTDDRRDTLNARIRAVVVLVVALSGAGVAVQAGGSWQAAVGGAALGGLVGYGAVRYLSMLASQARLRARDRRERRRFRNDERREETGSSEDGEVESERERRRQRP